MLDFFKRQFQHRSSYEQFNYEVNKSYKSKLDLIRLSSVVCGIEFCYAAETAFVSPILLQMGLPIVFMTWAWCLPPLIGFFLVPALGSLSDKCNTRFGRRRPFIFLYSIGILIGLSLVANGRLLGEWFGDVKNEDTDDIQVGNQTSRKNQENSNPLLSHKYGATLTVLGVLLLDLDCDACQSPSRAYLLDVTNPSQHALGLTTFTFMAGLGGCLGYFLGGIPWEHTFLKRVLGDHIHVLFTLVFIIYVICMILTLTASKESTDITNVIPSIGRSASRQLYVSSENVTGNANNENPYETSTNNVMTVSYLDYIRSIIYMPSSLRWLCLTNFFCWMALVSYSLYFTDFVGQAVFGGSPTLDFNDPLRLLYNDGVRFGSWGMSIYSISCSIYSYNIQALNDYFGIKRVYIGSQIIYAVGMLLMGCLRHRIGVIVFSAVAGILYSTLFTIPYLLISQYHTSNQFAQLNGSNTHGQIRGIGTDIAVVSSMVFLAQLCLSSTMGTLVHFAGSTVIVTIVASFLSICGAISATQVLYI
ncbi:unnamed protein product [Rotaria socialis]|uniref:Uncharacterized protein n=3 Tax=Rotaria socialis TaxID=392032 RepID=A0A818VRK5_9BILA|nr:unnamed protein product [Rotaria socialis]CAF3485484.1 unnamed protein product [Rotaria socialis]CAF3561303.1 unnamed protein product [Rotaria socialis]CAF3714854.1 unnamed protein product [Rotaria socialis]CAF4243407.1 unnamed protein product [Rotaria socialis]